MTSSQKHALGWFITIVGLSIANLVFFHSRRIVIVSGVEGVILLWIATIVYDWRSNDGESDLVGNALIAIICGFCVGGIWGSLLGILRLLL